MAHILTVDQNDDTGGFKITKRDADGMPVDEWGDWPDRKTASRSAANARYAAKTRRPVVRRD